MSDSNDDFLHKFEKIGREAQAAVDQVVDREGLRAKGAWQVRAGLIPKEPLPEFTKKWMYTSADYEQDSRIQKPSEVAKFSKLRAEAMDYYLQISDPRLNNWAELVFIWY